MKNITTKLMAEPPIVGEVDQFLAAHPCVTERGLALAAGVSPTVLNRVRNRKRYDMASAKADSLRVAMSLIPTTSPTKPPPC